MGGVLKKELHKTFEGEEDEDEEGPLISTLRKGQLLSALAPSKKVGHSILGLEMHLSLSLSIQFPKNGFFSDSGEMMALNSETVAAPR